MLLVTLKALDFGAFQGNVSRCFSTDVPKYPELTISIFGSPRRRAEVCRVGVGKKNFSGSRLVIRSLRSKRVQ